MDKCLGLGCGFGQASFFGQQAPLMNANPLVGSYGMNPFAGAASFQGFPGAAFPGGASFPF